MTFAWVGTRDERPVDTRVYAIPNDSESPVSQQVLAAMGHYNVSPALWSGREEAREDFAA